MTEENGETRCYHFGTVRVTIFRWQRVWGDVNCCTNGCAKSSDNISHSLPFRQQMSFIYINVDAFVLVRISMPEWSGATTSFVESRQSLNGGERYGSCMASCLTLKRPSSYRAVNTFHPRYKNQSVYAVSGTNRCLFSDKYKTHKYSAGRTYSC